MEQATEYFAGQVMALKNRLEAVESAQLSARLQIAVPLMAAKVIRGDTLDAKAIDEVLRLAQQVLEQDAEI
jgi:hypothetical protein